jgi:DNA-binding IclR family transcriptional regulator
MSFQAMAWAIKQPLPCQEKMVLLVLANYADEKATCFPSLSRLSMDCGLSQSQIRKCVAKLEKQALVRRHAQMRSYGQTSNVYALDLSITILAIKDPPI